MGAEKLSKETIIPVSQAHRLPIRTSPRTLRRWISGGLLDGHGLVVKLESFRHGKTLCTTLEAYYRFSKALARGREE